MLLAGLSVTNPLFAQTSATIINNYERANSILGDAFAEMNYNNTIGDVELDISGTFTNRQNQGVNAQSSSYRMSSVITFSDAGRSLKRADTFNRADKRVVSSYEISGDKIKVTEANEELKPSILEKEKYLYASAMFSPNMFLQLALRKPVGNTFMLTDDKYHIIRHDNGIGGVYFMYINMKTFYLEKIDQPEYDPVSGDYFLTTTYSNYNVRDGYQTAGKVVVSRDSAVMYSVNVEVVSIMQGGGKNVKLFKKELGPWVYHMPMKEWDANAVIVDMKAYLVVFDAPHSLEGGYTLVDNIKKAFPGVPIRYLVVSHYHPEHMGGIRAFLENGVSIITTKGNKDYIDALARGKHMFAETSVRSTKKLNVDYLFITDFVYEIKSDGRVIAMHPMGAKSKHADEYLIGYIPNERLLVEADLIRPGNMTDRKPNDRETALINYIEENKLNVKNIIQLSPIEGLPTLINYDDFRPKSDNQLKETTRKLKNVFK